MIIIKYLSLLLIVLICIYIGELKAKSYANRVIELYNFQNSFLMLKNKIEFTYEPINNIFFEISKTIYENRENAFEKTINQDGEFYERWNEAISELKNIDLEDKEILKMFGKSLGKTDIKGQVNQINLSLNLIEKQIEKAEIEKNKNYKLYKTMGVISGMAICIILL